MTTKNFKDYLVSYSFTHSIPIQFKTKQEKKSVLSFIKDNILKNIIQNVSDIAPKESLEVLRQLRTPRVARVHRDEDTDTALKTDFVS